ncbi:Six-hairpin glycosidase, partial [Aureobasidium melanogenum]
MPSKLPFLLSVLTFSSVQAFDAGVYGLGYWNETYAMEANAHPNATSSVPFTLGTKNFTFQVNVAELIPTGYNFVPNPRQAAAFYNLLWEGGGSLNQSIRDAVTTGTGEGVPTMCLTVPLGPMTREATNGYKEEDNGDCSNAFGSKCMQDLKKVDPSSFTNSITCGLSWMPKSCSERFGGGGLGGAIQGVKDHNRFSIDESGGVVLPYYSGIAASATALMVGVASAAVTGVTGKPEGFASSTTGGGDVTAVYPSTTDELVSYLGDDTARVIVLTKTFDFSGTEGTTTSSGCAPWGTGAGCQTAIDKDQWCENYEPDAPKVSSITYDAAGTLGITVASDKSIVGDGSKGVIKGKGLRIVNGATNVIIQNVAITDINPEYVWGGDAITLDGTDNVWIDHVTTSNIARQHIVLGTEASGNVTISNSYIDGSGDYSATCDGHQYWALYFDGSDDKVTFKNNYIYQTSGRAPKVQSNTLLHAVNNYWNDNSGHAFEIGKGGYVLAEGNVFEDVKAPLEASSYAGELFTADSGSACSSALGRSCEANSLSGSGSFSESNTDFLSKFSGAVAAAAKPASEMKSYVTANAGAGKLSHTFSKHSNMLVSHLLTLLGLGLTVQAQTCWENLTCSGPLETAFPGEWEANIFAPASRAVSPTSILSLANASIISKWPGPAHITGNGSALVFDFGKEVGGLATISYTAHGTGALGLAFSEAKNWIGLWSDSSNGKFQAGDGAIYSNFSASGNYSYTMDKVRLRGGFRYLTLFLITNETMSSIDINDITLEIGFQPTWSNLRAYSGYFHCSDDDLNKIWYSGAYTLQTNSVPVDTGRNFVSSGWNNSGALANGSTVIVDGAKRDRAVWPGDMGIAVPATFVSIGDLESVANALQTMYDHQNKDGSFPEAGPPLLQQGSDTYHMWSMIGTYNYLLYTNDTAFLDKNWDRYLHAMEYIYGKVHQPSGLLNVTGTRDWARWQQGFNNSEANMILYHTLVTGAELATWHGDTTGLAETYITRAANLSTAINKYCWDTSSGAFKDNATDTSLHPQDANSMAIYFGVVPALSSSAQSISSRLTDNWTPIGAEAPELPNNISPFISSFEIQAHLVAGQSQRALDLIRRSWGWYLHHPNGTGSTVIEGYLTNGSFAYRNSRGYSYDASYVSHSHGWSAGPTSALTNYIVGLSVTGRVGSTWTLKPQFADLEYAQAGFVTSLGEFSAGWNVTDGGRTYSLWWKVPEGTAGNITLPPLPSGKTGKITIDGKSFKNKSVDRKNGLVFETNGGNHSILVVSK